MAKNEKAKGGEGRSGAKALIFLGVSVVAGVAALVVVYQLIQGYQRRIQEAQAPEETVMAIVAARDLYQGITINEEDLFAVEIPPAYLHEDVYQSPEHVVGRIPRERILANEFIREERLADADEGIGLNAIIPRGMRAISINIADGNAVSGFLNPGNYVDMLVTLKSDEKESEPETRTLLQAVYVLAVNSRLGNESTREPEETADGKKKAKKKKKEKFKPSVTLAVTPEQAEEVAHAEAVGHITLALRNDLDVGYAKVEGSTVEKIVGEPVGKKSTKGGARRGPRGPRGPAKPPVEETSTGLQIIRGSNSKETKVPR